MLLKTGGILELVLSAIKYVLSDMEMRLISKSLSYGEKKLKANNANEADVKKSGGLP